MRASISFARRLSGKLVKTISVLFAIIILTLVATGYFPIYNLTIRNCHLTLDNSVLKMDKYLSGIETTTERSSRLLSDFASDTKTVGMVAETILKYEENILRCTITLDPSATDKAAESHCIAAYRNGDGGTASQACKGEKRHTDWYRTTKQTGKGHWSDPEEDGHGGLVATYAKPLYREDGTFLGVVECDVDIKEILTKINEEKPYEHATVAVVGSDASIHLAEGDSIVRGDSNLMAQGSIKADKSIHHVKNKGKNALAICAPAMNGWSNLLICPYSDIIATVQTANIVFLLITVLGILLLYLICRKTISRMSQPITEFAYAAMSIGQGNFETKILEVDTQDEFKRFSDSLHYMENSISGYIEELKKTTAANERFESELNIASQIQMQMLPLQFPSFAGIDLHASLKPAKEVGGDLYDFFVRERKLYFIVGDVSGKGVPAALYMAITKASFRTVSGLDIPVNEIASKVNDSFCSSNESGMFVTLFLGHIDLDTLKMEYCNCGHNPIVVVDKEGKASYLNSIPNLASGLIEGFEYQSQSLQLHEGMRLLIYTDGVTEAENRAKELYGEERLMEYVSQQSPDTLSETFVANLEQSIKAFTGSNPQSDDITIMSIRLKGPGK